MKPSHFDLEQQILSCWGVTDDLTLVLETLEASDIDVKYLDTLTNLILGLQAVYQAKFEKCFKTFGDLVECQKF